MECRDIGYGTYDCSYNIMLPYLVTDPLNPDEKPRTKTVCIDKCLLPEIVKLWELEIKTTGCCCGHGNSKNSYIGVLPEYIERMKALGYKVRFNPCRPCDEDSFIPKTIIQYGSAERGFNWWDEYDKTTFDKG